MENLLPAGFRWREFWDFKGVVGTTVPSAVQGGHALTLQNEAAKRTTADGVHFDGTATSNCVVAAHADNNDFAAFHVTIRFKFDQTFSSASTADQYLFNKALAADDYIRLRFESTDGLLYFEQGNEAAGQEFQLTSSTASWTAGTWYTVTASFTDTPAQRLLVNGTAEDTDTVATPIASPNGGDIVIGNSTDGGTDGFEGTIAYVLIGNGATAAVELTTTEETELAAGLPPATAKVQYLLDFDEGRGTTVNNRGSGTGDGTLDTAAAATWTWDFAAQKLACFSLDGINDYASSSSGVDISGNLSMVWAGKMKATYDAVRVAIGAAFMLRMHIDATNYLSFAYDAGGDTINWGIGGDGTPGSCTYATKPSIDDYWIMVGTTTIAGNMQFFVNGILVATDTGIGLNSGAAATCYLGAEATPSYYDVSKPVLVGLIEGALNAEEAKQLSRRIDQRYEFGLGI